MRADAIRGHLDGLLLGLLADGSRHGYAIIEELTRRSGGELSLPTGTIYPALRRLEEAGLLSGAWSTINGRKRRVYSLTATGRDRLTAHRADWQALRSVVEQVMGTAT